MIWREMNNILLDTNPNKSKIMFLARRFNLSPLMMNYLFAYDIKTEGELSKFIYPSVEDFHNPFELNDMTKGINRIIRAIKNKEKIFIFGDYDCDGITSTTIMYQGIKKFGGLVSYRLPIRSEGYGLSPQAINELDDSISLIVTVDNGSSAHPAMEIAKSRGIDVIVTDHHEILDHYPDCYAFINPKRSDNTYPCDKLCGAGVAFKIVHALHLAANLPWEKHFHDYIELTTLGTIADLMPLTGENRTICWFGIKKLNLSPSLIFKNLFKLLKVTSVDSSTIGFLIGPIFNSCGRIDNPNRAVSILLNPNPLENQLTLLIEMNKKRQEITKEQFQQIERKILLYGWYRQNVIVVVDDFHEGIIGIIAAKIADRFKKPAIVITTNGTGSARSVNGTSFSIINVINSCGHFLTKFGGHQAAAGLSIPIDFNHIDEFSKAIQHAATNEPPITPEIKYLCKLPVNEFPNELFWELQLLEPFGMGFPKPTFHSSPFITKNIEQFGKEKQHLKFSYKERTAIAFSKGEMLNQVMNKPTEILYTPFNTKSMHFIVQDIRTIP
jgi:single-stranded-DNA-specific exonuclease